MLWFEYNVFLQFTRKLKFQGVSSPMCQSLLLWNSNQTYSKHCQLLKILIQKKNLVDLLRYWVDWILKMVGQRTASVLHPTGRHFPLKQVMPSLQWESWRQFIWRYLHSPLRQTAFPKETKLLSFFVGYKFHSGLIYNDSFQTIIRRLKLEFKKFTRFC